MAYRGEDLDLRTAQSWTSQGPDLQDPMPSAGLRPRLFVDDTVLACLNDAYDLAAVHRAGEVRLEHLLNAMTRVDAATRVMEMNGVRVATLRRDTGMVITSEIPVAYAAGKGTPRTGADIEDVLRLAAERAYARRQPITTEDILDALAEPGREFAGLQVLRRNWASRPLLREAATALALPSFTRPFTVDEPRERIRVPARPVAYTVDQPRADVQQAMTDSAQNSRIEALERLVRDLASELNAERKGMSAVFVDMQRELAAARDDSARYRGGLSDRLKSLELAVVQSASGPTPQVTDRLGAIERGLDARFSDLARSWGSLGERLQGLEYGLQQARSQDQTVDMKPVERQLGDIARTLGALADRIAMLERTGSRPPASNEPVLDRITQLERVVNNGLGEGARNWLAMGERMKAMEKAVTTRPAAEPLALAPVIERIEVMQRAISQRPAQPALSLAPVIDRIEALERSLAQRAAQPAVSLAPVMERLEALERSIRERPQPVPAVVSLTPVIDRMAQMERTLEVRSSDASKSVGQLAERIRLIEDGLTAQRTGLAEVATRVAGEVKAATQHIGTGPGGMVERVQALIVSLDRQRAELAAQVTQPVAQIATRLSGLDTQVSGLTQRVVETAKSQDGDLIELHDALVKISDNQQTLATALDQWRLDTAGDLNVITTRISDVEKMGEKPAQMMQQLAADVQAMQATQLRREARKSRFRMWLFGTEDWFGDSWERHTEHQAQSVAKSAAAAKAGTIPYIRR